MVISEDSQYNGEGGILIRDPAKTLGYVIEPMTHYLKRTSPIYFEE
jgi:hypothetical protein